MLGECGCLFDAEERFDEMPERSTFAYNAMLGAYVSYGETKRAIELYADMRCLDVPLDAHTCSYVLKASAGERESWLHDKVRVYL